VERLRQKQGRRWRRRMRVRRNTLGTPARPRLAVRRSLANIYAQIIDDMAGKTLVACSSLSSDIQGAVGYGGNVKAAVAVGEALAGQALAKGITKVVFDRGAAKYHGRVKALAESARKKGLQF